MSVKALNWACRVLKAGKFSASQRLVLFALSHHHHERMDACFPSVQTIAALSGLSERRARGALRDLEAMGLIKARKRSVWGRQRSNQYDLFGSIEGGRVRPPKTAFEGGRGGPPSVAGRGRTVPSDDKEGTKREGAESADVLEFRAREFKTGGKP